MEEGNKKDFRLTELIEPTDEQLSVIMKDAAEEARKKSEIATADFFWSIQNHLELKKKGWSKKYNVTFPHA